MHPLAPVIIVLIVGLPAFVFVIFKSYQNHKRTLAEIDRRNKETDKLFASLGIPQSFTIQLPLSILPQSTLQISQSVFYNARFMLVELYDLNVPKSVYIKHYLKHVDASPTWKQDFLTFCNDNNLGISEQDIENGTLLK
jgi:hypothetical protein